MRKRVLLVKSHDQVVKNMAACPPLGVLSLAAYLRARGDEVWALDLRFCSRGALATTVRQLRPALVGISALTSEERGAARAAVEIKQAAPDTAVVLGGPHATGFWEEALCEFALDACVLGEGEETLAELVDLASSEGPRWRDPKNLAGVRGVAYRDPESGQPVRTAPRPPIQDLDALPFPAWDLLDMAPYWTLPSMSSLGIRPYMPLFTSRGCPYRCVYCHEVFGKTCRSRSPERVVEEIRLIRERYGISDLEVVDDVANLHAGRFDGILTGLLDQGLRSRISFPNGVRADLLRESSIALLDEVGAGEVSIAIETASARLQKVIGKNLDLDRAAAAIEALARRRVMTRGFFMLGLPSEDEQEMRATIDFACRSPLHLALFFTVNPFKGTRLFELLRRAGKLDGPITSDAYQYFGGDFNGSDVPDERFRWLYRLAYYRFYSDPGRVLRILRDRPYWSDLPRRALHMVRNAASFRKP
jgi:anaerobic magnesium-protoporphyrin IX monomethyl ester cyclase